MLSPKSYSAEPVSYTHLVWLLFLIGAALHPANNLNVFPNGKLSAESCIAPPRNAWNIIGFIIGSVAVSYTHLDVYKRQLVDHRLVRRHVDPPIFHGCGMTEHMVVLINSSSYRAQ